MSNKYIVIKLPKSWIGREATKQRVKMFFDDIDVLDDKNTVTCSYTMTALKESIYHDKAFKDYVKRKIAIALGEHFLEQGLIRFFENEGQDTIKIEGEITVISEAHNGIELVP